MRRKCGLILLLLLCSCLLSGCALTDMINNFMNDKRRDEAVTTITSDSMLPMSAYTKEKQSGVLEASAKLDEQDSGWQFWRWPFDETYCAPWNTERQDDKLNNKLSKANNRYENAKAQDTTFLMAKQQKEQQQQAAEDKAFNEKWKPIIIIGLIALILVIVLVLVKRGSPRVVHEAEPVLIEGPTLPPSDSIDVNTRDLEQTEQQKRNALESMCKKVNMDPDEVLAQCGGDIDKAFLEVSLMS